MKVHCKHFRIKNIPTYTICYIKGMPVKGRETFNWCNYIDDRIEKKYCLICGVRDNEQK